MSEQMNSNVDSYKGTVSSIQYNGEATLIIDEAGLTISSLFSDLSVGYEEIFFIKSGDYTVEITTTEETICCSRMGNSGDWFRCRLLQGYSNAVSSALLAKGSCLFETKGAMTYENIRAKGLVRVFEDCICLLPAQLAGRRLPFSFLCCMKKENYALTLRFTTGEICSLSMLGRDLDPLEACIMENVRKMREQNGVMIGNLCRELSVAQKTKAAGLLPQRIAVPMTKIAALPVLEQAVTEKIRNSGMQKTWPVLAEVCDGEKMCVGIWELPEEEVERLKSQLLERLSADAAEGAEAVTELTPEQEDALRWMIWAAVPSKDGQIAVVESAFPNEATATYIYRIPGTWEEFLPILNRTMDAVDFNREVIMMPEEKIFGGAHPAERMLIQRTPALMALRRQFAGRVIHQSESSWRNGLLKYLNGTAL